MGVYFNSETILASILNYYPDSSSGIDIMLIEKYCEEIRKLLSEKLIPKADFIVFQINEYEMDREVSSFPKQFEKFMGRYYKGDHFKFPFFDNRSPNIDYFHDIMYIAAINLLEL